MKNTIKFLGIIALVAVIGFSMAGCDILFPEALEITTSSTLPDGTVGMTYSHTLAAKGSKPITWSRESGTLPAGLILEGTTGTIAGMPTTAGTYTFTVKATNSEESDTKEFSITISAAGPGAPKITTTSLAGGGTVGTAYSRTLLASGTAPIAWILDSGTLPGGLILSPAGVISGIPTVAETKTFTVKATNSAGSDTKEFSITITGGGPALTGTPTITGTPQQGQTLTAGTSGLNGTGTYSYQWKRSDSSSPLVATDISGATSGTYTLVQADLGKYIFVTVTCSSNSGSQTSSSTAKIEATSSWVRITNHPFDGTGYSDAISGVTYGNNKWIAYGYKSKGMMATSTDGLTWTEITGHPFNTTNVYNYITSVAYGSNNTWVAGNWDGKMMTSADNGVNWTEITSHRFWAQDTLSTPVRDIAYGNNRWVAVADNGQIAYSDDGTTWTAVEDSTFSDTDIEAVAWGSNKWVAAGYSGKMATSADGITWTAVTGSPLEGTYAIKDVAYNNNLWVAVTTSAEIATSANGTTWTIARKFDFMHGDGNVIQLDSIAYGNGRWVVAGRGMATSTAGILWPEVGVGTFATGTSIPSIYGVAYGNGKFVGVAYGNIMAYSPTGE